MKTLLVSSFVALALSTAPAAGGAELPGQLLVKLEPGAAPVWAAYAEVASSRPALPVPRRDDRVGLARIHLVEVEPGTERAVLDRLASHPGVEWAEQNSAGGGVEGSLVPSDPFYFSQWNLEQANDEDIDALGAWELRGTYEVDPDLVIAVIDTGFPLAAPPADVAGLEWVHPTEVVNGVDDDGNGFVDDVNGYDFVDGDADLESGPNDHGIFVSSIIASRTDNGLLLAGICNGAQLQHLRAFDQTGDFPSSGPYAGKLSAAAAVIYAVDNGADLVNNSWTDQTGPTQVIVDAVQYAVDNDVHMIFSAGNQNISDPTPVQNPGVIAVAALNQNGQKVGFSNWGPWVDVSAAGENVIALGSDGIAYFVAGTSFSAPQVTGIVAHLLSEDGDLSTLDLRTILRQGAKSVDAKNPAWVGQLGAGQASALRSLELLLPFADERHATAGDFAPVLNGWGATGAGERVTLSVSQGPPVAPGFLILGAPSIDLPILGGVLVPSPLVILPMGTNALGDWVLPIPLTAAIPTGGQLWFQVVVADAGAPQGLAFTNGVRLTGQ